ncbi:hypothetical protein MTR_7g050415 [Medicago truncatula]|uniref:Uncharacterized protein n=1 Tax=Medicago truncatula TaxID=3880 RepID=A0A072TZ56_MEDTR|nr:hypothetical protein MTR_7g050415 [Medicago truncatula]
MTIVSECGSRWIDRRGRILADGVAFTEIESKCSAVIHGGVSDRKFHNQNMGNWEELCFKANPFEDKDSSCHVSNNCNKDDNNDGFALLFGLYSNFF